ncbi:MAG: flavin reductase family protein [Candidatus Thorarchaeota archaeon]|jgi:flavin reductase (DIM6/NTAB) family NADH-FMN oxidoreductase RutF
MKREFKSTDSKVPCNSIVPNSVTLLSVQGNDRPNILTITLTSMLSSHPPVLGVGMRSSRFSFDLVKEAGDFAINIPTADMLEAVKLAGKKTGRDCDKFEELGLTPMPSTTITSPIIKECPINVECKVIQTMELGSHDLIIAEILTTHLDDSILVPEKDKFDPSKMKLLSYFPVVDEYWTFGEKI